MTKEAGLDFFVDKLTNSIENVKSGDTFPTEVSVLSREELKRINPKNGWRFDWKNEFEFAERELYKLTIVQSPEVVQGLVSLEAKPEHVYMHLIESAPFNIGKDKVYQGVPGNLIAFACKLSFQRGGQGYVAFLSKTSLITHYSESLGAIHVGGQLMVINTSAAMKLIGRYF
jgi:hypothetical protein